MFATTASPPIDPGSVEARLSCSNSLLFALDGLAMNLEKGYRPAGDFIIEDADYQSAGIPSLCIEVCPTFYRSSAQQNLAFFAPRTRIGFGFPARGRNFENLIFNQRAFN
jgi:hypothetical protein